MVEIIPGIMIMPNDCQKMRDIAQLLKGLKIAPLKTGEISFVLRPDDAQKLEQELKKSEIKFDMIDFHVISEEFGAPK